MPTALDMPEPRAAWLIPGALGEVTGTQRPVTPSSLLGSTVAARGFQSWPATLPLLGAVAFSRVRSETLASPEERRRLPKREEATVPANLTTLFSGSRLPAFSSGRCRFELPFSTGTDR